MTRAMLLSNVVAIAEKSLAPVTPPARRRYPSTFGGLIYLIVVLTTLVGLAMVAFGSWRRGVALVGFTLVFAAVHAAGDEGGRGRHAARAQPLVRRAPCWQPSAISLIALAANIPDQAAAVTAARLRVGSSAPATGPRSCTRRVRPHHPGVELVAVWGRDLGRASTSPTGTPLAASTTSTRSSPRSTWSPVAVPPHVQAELASALPRPASTCCWRSRSRSTRSRRPVGGRRRDARLSTWCSSPSGSCPIWEDWLHAGRRDLTCGRPAPTG